MITVLQLKDYTATKLLNDQKRRLALLFQKGENILSEDYYYYLK